MLTKKTTSAVLMAAIIFSSHAVKAAFCNWGADGTGASSVCEGGAQGGNWCNANENQCTDGCGGRWCKGNNGGGSSPPTGPSPSSPTTGGSQGGCGSGWTPAGWTTYTSYAACCPDSPNFDPNADTTECDEFSACSYTGDFAYIGHQSYNYVRSNNLIAFFSTHGDNASFGNKRIRISALGKTVEGLIADTCGDGDCDGCCTQNAGSSGYLVDMEYHTVVNNFGSIGAAQGQVCWQLIDDDGNISGGGGGGRGGFCNWGPDGTGDSSVCQGGAQGGDWCNANQDNCESGCGGKWC